MDNNIIYKAFNFTIEKADYEKRIEYFEAWHKNFVKNNVHTIEYINWRNELKQEIMQYVTDKKDITYFIRYNNEIAGVFIIEPETNITIPQGKKIFILKRFRKSKAIVCILDFILNHLYKDKGIQISRQNAPGLEKMFVKLHDDVGVFIIDPKTIERVNKIMETNIDGNI